MDILFYLLRRVRDSNPRYDVMRIPHFECGSFDHSDNSPQKKRAKVLLFSDICKFFCNFFLFYLHFIESIAKNAINFGY